MKPEVDKSGICSVINGALSKISGAFSDLKEGVKDLAKKALKGAGKGIAKAAKATAKGVKNAVAGITITEKDVILIRSQTGLGNTSDTASGQIRRLPDPGAILNIID